MIVSDTSPIRALQHLGLVDLLRDLYGQILVPPAVAKELQRPPAWLPAVNISLFPFVQVQAPRNQTQVQLFLQKLHLGEAEALALAVEVQAKAILIDEASGRAVAKQLGLVAVGVLGVLLRAKKNGLIVAVRPLMERLVNELNFFISAKLRAEVLRLAGE